MKDSILKGEKGDYLVTHQRKIYSILSIHRKTDTKILLEEIAIPEHLYKKQHIQSMKDWASKGAIGHSMWMIYEIDMTNGCKILNVYSPTEKTHYKVSTEDMFFAKLLTLPLKKIADSERRKIGPPPLNGEKDYRPLWNPTFMVDGKKEQSGNKNTFSAYRTTFPNDGSELASKSIDLYFADNGFCLPIWIHVDTGHYTVMVNTIDSGKGLASPASFVPSTYPKFVNTIQKTNDEIILKMKDLDVEYYQHDYILYAVDITDPKEKHFQRVPYTLTRKSSKEVSFHIDKKDGKSLLEKKHRYIFVLHPTNSPDLFIDHSEIFQW